MIKTYQLRRDALLLGLPATATGQHVAILDNFNPETEEVVIVKRDATRVWIDRQISNHDDCQFMHLAQPTCHGTTASFAWTGPHYKRLPPELALPLNDGDCIEFVAVKTHRPPETKPEPSVEFEPIPPETQAQVSEIMRNAGIPETDEAKVKRVYPDAYAECGVYGWTIYGRSLLSGVLTELCPLRDSVSRAWKSVADAIDREANRKPVPNKPNPPNPARFGITVLDAAPSAIGGVA